MERIVCGMAQMSFRTDPEEAHNENCAPNSNTDVFASRHTPFCNSRLSTMAAGDLVATKAGQQAADDDVGFGSGVVTTTCDDDEDEEVEAVSATSRGRGKCGTLAQRRCLPSRASKENSRLGIKQRSIAKSAKRSQTRNNEMTPLKPVDIRKIYLNKKLTNFRPSCLETIFEESPDECCAVMGGNQMRLIGGRKIRRSLSCSDGLNVNKALVNKRRAKIKKVFGRRFALKKISLEDFLDHFNGSTEDDRSPSDPVEDGAVPLSTLTSLETMDADANSAFPIYTAETCVAAGARLTASTKTVPFPDDLDRDCVDVSRPSPFPDKNLFQP